MNQFARTMGIVLTGILVLGFGSVAMAAGTTSGTSVQNSATVDYSVGGFAQAQITSNSADFVVDNRVDLTVTTVDVAAVTVLPGSVAVVQTFLVTNVGNTVQDYRLAATDAAAAAFGLTENFDAVNVNVFVDGNGNGTYEVAADVATYVEELAEDASVAVFVVADIPAAQAMGDVASYDLLAVTAAGGTPAALGADVAEDNGVDDPAVVQVVFGDGAGIIDAVEDGQFSSRDSYEVANANLAITKAAAVVWDPFNLAVNPKGIPGARVTYTIDVDNTGTGSANNVVVVDALPAGVALEVGTVVSTGTLDYSNDGGATYGYVPVADANGVDLTVTHVQITWALFLGGGTNEQTTINVMIQ